MCQSQTPYGWSSHWRPALSVKRKPHTSTHTHTDILVRSRYLVCQPAAMCLSTCGFTVHNLAARRVEDTCQEERTINKSQETKIVLLRDLRAWGPHCVLHCVSSPLTGRIVLHYTLTGQRSKYKSCHHPSNLSVQTCIKYCCVQVVLQVDDCARWVCEVCSHNYTDCSPSTKLHDSRVHPATWPPTEH